MLLSSVKKSIEKKLDRSFKIPDDDVLSHTIYEAMLYVAAQCEPQKLVCYPDGEEKPVFRMLSEGRYITFPDFPNFEEEDKDIVMDEMLSYAVIHETCFLLSGEEKFDQQCTRWISMFKRAEINGYYGDKINED